MIALERQTFLDLAIQACGIPEAAFDFAMLNGVSLTDDPGVVELAVPPVVNSPIATYYANKKLYPATGFDETDEDIERIFFEELPIEFS